MKPETQTAVVTGASRGFGLALVHLLADDGWTVFAVARTLPDKPRDDVTWVEWDITHPDTTALDEAIDGAAIDLLVNNAGRGAPQRTLAELDLDQLDAVMKVNLIGVLRVTQALRSNLLAAREPVVVNVSSRLASLADQSAAKYQEFKTSYAYRISKAAQNMATICLANELGPRIRFLALHPGELATPMGQPNAHTSPTDAAGHLLALLARRDYASPMFLRATGEHIDW